MNYEEYVREWDESIIDKFEPLPLVKVIFYAFTDDEGRKEGRKRRQPDDKRPNIINCASSDVPIGVLPSSTLHTHWSHISTPLYPSACEREWMEIRGSSQEESTQAI